MNKHPVILTAMNALGQQVPFGYGGAPIEVTPSQETLVCMTLDPVTGAVVPITFLAGPDGGSIVTKSEAGELMVDGVGTGIFAAPALDLSIGEDGHLYNGETDLGNVTGEPGADADPVTLAVGTVTEGLAWGFEITGASPDFTLNITTPPV